MQLRYGNYYWPVDSVQVAERTPIHRNTARMPTMVTLRITISGDLLVANGLSTPAQMQDDLSQQEVLMKAALGVPYQDLVFIGDDGSVMATSLLNANSLSGVTLVDGPHFPGTKATAEYASRRAFEFSMEVTVLYPRRITPLESFQETLSFRGGLPEKKMVRSINIAPQDQTIWPFTEFEATQSGTAVGLLTWPFGGPKSMPPYRFPAITLRGAPIIEASGPERIGPNKYINYAIKWQANFVSNQPLIAAPTLWT